MTDKARPQGGPCLSGLRVIAILQISRSKRAVRRAFLFRAAVPRGQRQADGGGALVALLSSGTLTTTEKGGYPPPRCHDQKRHILIILVCTWAVLKVSGGKVSRCSASAWVNVTGTSATSVAGSA